MDLPLISVITVNYNNQEGLKRTIESVQKQQASLFEFLVIDGGSTDKSIDIIQRYADGIDYWISEKDRGVYDAMNKGILQARGTYIIFMNSGDTFASSSVLGDVKGDLTTRMYDLVYGNIIYQGKTITYTPKLGLYYMLHIGISHQSVFIKKELFDKTGLYDLTYKITADSCHLILCLVRHRASSLYVNMVIADIEPDGMSTQAVDANREEKKLFMRTEFPALAADYELLSAYNKKDILGRLKRKLGRKFGNIK